MKGDECSISRFDLRILLGRCPANPITDDVVVVVAAAVVVVVDISSKETNQMKHFRDATFFGRIHKKTARI